MIRTYLNLHRQSGIEYYPASEALQRFLAGSLSRRPVASVPGNRRDSSAGRPGREAPMGLDRLREMIRECTACDLAGETADRFTGLGNAAPDLMVIGDYPGPDREGIWGGDEDAMFWKMMAAIGLDRDRIYVSNCIRCRTDQSMIEAGGSQRPCLAFIARELAAVRPRLVCTMGGMATGLVLRSREPLFRLRGRFHSCALQTMETVQVMPTFHPRFLGRHPEMKRAAWMDLQRIQHRLATIQRKRSP